MLKALYVFATLTGWGPVFDLSVLSVSVATYENQYYQILRLRKESQALSEAEHAEKRRVVLDRFARNYASLEFLSFRRDITFFWCTDGDWRSYLPMEFWPTRSLCSSTARMTPENLHVETSVEARRYYSFFLTEARFMEFRWPMEGLPGEYTEYPFNGICWRLADGLDGFLCCLVRPLTRPWIGDMTKTLWYRHLSADGLEVMGRSMCESWCAFFAEASWLGVVRRGGELCDVLLVERDSINRWDVLFVDSRGFKVAEYAIKSDPDQPNDKWLVVVDYRDVSTAPLLPAEFVPSEALMREAQAWRGVGTRKEVPVDQ